jgi:predicted PurR-regulated permease PerM
MADAPHRRKTYVERVLIAAAAIIAVLLLLTLIYFVFDVLLLIFAAVLLAIFLNGLADLLRRWIPLGDGWLVLIVAVLLVAMIAGAVAFLAPNVAEQARILRSEVPRAGQQAAEYLARFSWGQAIISQLPTIDDVMAKVDPGAVLSRVGGYFSSTIGVVGNIFVTVLLAVYLASEPRLYSGGLTQLFPITHRRRAAEVATAIYETLRWWLIGKAGSMIFIGVLTWIGLSIIGVPLALTLGLIAGLLSFIPNFGPIISAVPALLIAAIDSPFSAVYVLALYVGVQLVESNVVTPIIERETVELAPALTIVFQIALGALIGGLGLILATPLLAVIVVVVRMVYIEDVLGDRSGTPDAASDALIHEATPSAEAAETPSS